MDRSREAIREEFADDAPSAVEEEGSRPLSSTTIDGEEGRTVSVLDLPSGTPLEESCEMI